MKYYFFFSLGEIRQLRKRKKKNVKQEKNIKSKIVELNLLKAYYIKYNR